MSDKTVLFISKGIDSASTRYRALDYFRYLEQAGWSPCHLTADGHPWARLKLLQAVHQAHTVVVLRKSFALPYARLLRYFAKHLIFDMDDAIFCASDGSYSSLRARRFAHMATLCDQIWVGNAYLGQEAKRYNHHVIQLPTSIDCAKYTLAPRQEQPFFDLVWIGSQSTRKYLNLAIPFLQQTMRQIPHLRLTIIADFSLVAPPLPIVCLPWSTTTEAQQLAQAHVGIAPMLDNPWTRGKCALKVLQYMAAGLPVVSSNCGVNAEVIEHGKTGLLVEDTAESWSQALVQLANQPALQHRMGALGRTKVEQYYSLAATATRMQHALETTIPS